ncbi:MAG TPA: Ig-like domain-containing protein [Moraxellaceae bacterium]|nr:Ig-like domain-containing protein [Moraxellaceae bacterium]
MRTLLLFLMCTLLAACGGDKQSTSTPAAWSPGASLVYAYPYDGQARIAPTAPVVLQFSTVVSEAGGGSLASAFTLTPEGGAPVAFTLTTTNGGKGVVLTPNAPLAENTNYTVAWSNLAASDGLVPPVELTFTTRPADKGAASAISSSATFQVERALPTQAGFPFMDFSTLRLQFSQPVDEATLQYGVTVRLEDDSAALVPATVLVTGPLLSIDPRSDLVAGRTYRLKLTTGLKSVTGNALVPGAYADFALVPSQSGPRATMALEVPDSAAGATLSPLTGAAINNVPITSTLLGNNSASQQAGNLYAELAFVPNYPVITPLAMRRGNMLNGSSVTVKIVGVVPAGLDTEAIHVNIISDANGYMVPNPYSTALDAPRLVYLTMDASMSADNASANGAFTQNLLHIDVVGTAIVKDGKLVMDAVGVTELDVLGLDRAAGVLSFHLEGYQDQAAAPAQPADTTAPTLQSWLPGNEAKRARPGDPVILTFSEPLDPDTLTTGSLQLLRNGVAQAISWRVDGTSVVVRPASPLEHNAEYTVVFSAAITDLAGNGISDGTHQRVFSLPALSAPASRSPAVLATYPGFACVTTGRNVASGVQGRCAGGDSGDDLLPLPAMPTDRSIQVQFSQNMDAASIVLGTSCNTGSFRVETWDNDNNCQVVPGRLEVAAQSLRFTPDSPWSVGKLYRYVLNSNGNGKSSTATCDGTQAICGSNGLPLQTQPLASSASNAPTATGGGPALEIWFTGAAKSPWVAQRLRGLPAYDTNANFVHDAGEEGPVDTGGGLWLAPNAARVITTAQSGLVSSSNIGCAPGSSCPEEQFLYLSNALDVEVADYDAVAGGVRVLIQPQQLLASSFTVYANTSFGNTSAATGQQIFRLRYAYNAATGKRDLPITGIIRYQDGALQMSGSLDLYLDEPSLAPSLIGIPINHNLHSYPLSLSVSGPVYFLPDGRMLATLANDNDVDFTVNLTAASVLPGGSITLRIPKGTMRLEGVSQPIKK